MSFEQLWEDNIYSRNQQINRYPYGDLVSVFFNSLQFLPKELLGSKKQIRVLELGSGAGNNLWFIDENGFDVYGIDGSKTACEIAKGYLEKRNSSAKIVHGYFDDLPFDDEFFDIIIDRKSTCCGTFGNINIWWNEAKRVLKKGGIIITFRYSDDSSDLIQVKNLMLEATKVEENTYKDFKSGKFEGVGIIHFASFDELKRLFSFCDIKYINKQENKTVLDTSDNKINSSEWLLVGVKK